MGGNEPICDGVQHWIGFASCSKLIAETLRLLRLPNPRHTDAKGFQNPSDLVFQILAQSDRGLFLASDQRTQTIRHFAADVNWSEPVHPCELCQTFCISTV